MINLTDHLLSVAPNMDDVFRAALGAPTDKRGRLIKPVADYAVLADVRGRHGFKAVPTDLLTKPSANHKLNGAIVKSYGLTLFHSRLVLDEVTEAPRVSCHRRIQHRRRVTHARIVLNMCPNAGHCRKVCVVENGNGRYESVQRAWMWRTDLLARHPESFARILAFELRRAITKYGRILFRPNVNSDAQWERILPTLADGSVDGLLCYGYSKLPSVLESFDGWMGPSYRVAYSWNETSDASAVSAFVARGGSVAYVDPRKKGDLSFTIPPFATDGALIVDADKTDEWMLTDGANVGSLSAKGKARQLIGRSRFVVTAVRLAVAA